MDTMRRLTKDLALEIRELILFLNIEKENTDEKRFTEIGVLFSRPELGTLVLSGEDAHQYRVCLSSLINAYESNEMISARMIEELLQTAILKSIDIPESQPETSIESRIEKSIKELEDELSREPHKYEIFLQVNGISIEGLPLCIGGIKFSQFNQTELSKFKERATTSYSPQEMEEELRPILGVVVANIDVQALDKVAARMIATKRLRLVLDVINFFSDLIPYTLGGFAHLPDEWERHLFVIPILENSNSSYFHYERSKPFEDLSLEKLIQTDLEKKLGLSAIEKMVEQSNNELQNRIIASIQWAGRATVYSNKRREEAFLLYIIALECIILAENNLNRKSYHLQLRVSHLLGGSNKESRKRISQEIGYLYQIRNRIVHDGEFQITDTDLALARYLTKGCLIKILIEEPFCSLQSIEKFIQVLRGLILQ